MNIQQIQTLMNNTLLEALAKDNKPFPKGMIAVTFHMNTMSALFETEEAAAASINADDIATGKVKVSINTYVVESDLSDDIKSFMEDSKLDAYTASEVIGSAALNAIQTIKGIPSMTPVEFHRLASSKWLNL